MTFRKLVIAWHANTSALFKSSMPPSTTMSARKLEALTSALIFPLILMRLLKTADSATTITLTQAMSFAIVVCAFVCLVRMELQKHVKSPQWFLKHAALLCRLFYDVAGMKGTAVAMCSHAATCSSTRSNAAARINQQNITLIVENSHHE